MTWQPGEPLLAYRMIDNDSRHVGDYTHEVVVEVSPDEWRTMLVAFARAVVARYGVASILSKLLRAGEPREHDPAVDDRYVQSLGMPRWSFRLGPDAAARLAAELEQAAEAPEICSCGRAVDVPAGGTDCGRCIERRDVRVVGGV